MHTAVRVGAAIAALTLLTAGGWYIDRQRDRRRSELSGYFEVQPTQIASRAPGRVTSILVREGDHVNPGQPLIVLEASVSRDQTQALEQQAEQARATYRDLRTGPRPEEIARQRQAVQEQQANLQRLLNGPLPEEIEASEAQLRETDASYEKALAGSRPQEIAEARAEAATAKAQLAAVLRGPTQEERAQAKARLDAAAAQARLAGADADRFQNLYRREAVTKQQLDQALAARDQSAAKQDELQQAYQRAIEGNPAEERRAATESYRQAQARLALVEAGSRREDITAARAARDKAMEDLRLVRRGARVEDIAAARARLAQAREQLAVMLAGSRPQQVAAAHAAMLAADAQARSAESASSERVVRATEPGTVDRVLVAPGDLLPSGAPVISETRPGDLFMRVYVPENDLSRVSVGDSASVLVDGIGTPLMMRVESISSQGEFTPANLQSPDERGGQVFGVRLRPAHPDPRLKSGMFALVQRLGGLHE